MSSDLTYEEYYKWIKEAEVEAARNPDGYKRKVGLFAIVGYGFVFALLAVIIILIAAILYLSFYTSGGAAAKVKLLVIFGAFAWVIVSSMFVKFSPPKGRRITKQQFPLLFKEIEALQNRLETLRIHEVILSHGMNAFVVQTPRLGVFGWYRNTLSIGLELLLLLSPEEAKAVIAHELGHLSGNHSKFSAWIYRVRRIWSKMMQKMEENPSYGRWFIEKFFFWYVPRFDAYSFALRRQNEYEADLAAAELTSSLDTARALIKVNALDRYIEDIYWNDLDKQSLNMPKPDTFAYTGLIKVMEQHEISEEEYKKLEISCLRRETDYEDTHPALKDRLSALQQSDCRLDISSVDFKQSAAHLFLGGDFEKVIAEYDQEWWNNIQAVWIERFETAQREKKELEHLRGLNRSDLNQENYWRLAYLTYSYEGDEMALPLFKGCVETYPEEHDANMMIGRILAKRRDDQCLETWRKIPANHAVFVHVCDEASQYLHEVGREEERDDWLHKGDAKHQELMALQQEYATIKRDDTFIKPTQFDPDHEAYIMERLNRAGFVKAAWIAQKQMSQDINIPCYIIIFEANILRMPSAAEYVSGQDVQDILIKEFDDIMELEKEMDIYVVNARQDKKVSNTIKDVGIKLI